MGEKTLLEMAKELDEMDRDVTGGEADFLDRVLRILKADGKLTPKEEARLELVHEKYLGGKEGEKFPEDDADDSDVDDE